MGENIEHNDRQFKAFLRVTIETLKEILAEEDEDKRNAKLEKVIDNLQKSLED